MAKKRKAKSGKPVKGSRKPRSQWSKPYRKRVERAERKGLSRQAARGHKPQEHIHRKEAKGLTAAQSHAVDHFARMQAHRAGSDQGDEAARRLKAWAREKGFGQFEKLAATIERRKREKRARSKVKVRKGKADKTGRTIKTGELHISTGGVLSAMQDDFEDFELPEMPGGDDVAWFYYN